MPARIPKTRRLCDPAIVAGVILLNLILKGWYLGDSSVAGDEPFSIYLSQMEIPAILAQLKTGNNPPLFEILLHYWTRLAGISPVAVRFLPFLFSSFIAGILYLTGARHLSRTTGVIAALLFTFSNYHTGFAHEARVYSLFALLTVLSMFAFLNLAAGKARKANLALLILSNILLAYAHYFGLLVPVIQLVSLVFSGKLRREAGKATLLSCAAAGLAFLPYWPVVADRFHQSAGDGTWVPPSHWDDLYTMLWRWSNAPVVTVLILAILAAALGKAALRQFPGIRPPVKVILVWFLLPYLVMHLVSLPESPFPIPMFLDRYVIFISPAFYLTAAMATAYLLEHAGIWKMAAVVPVVSMLVTCRPNVSNKREVKELMTRVSVQKREKTALLLCPPAFVHNFLYYYDREAFRTTAGDPSGSELNKYLSVNQIVLLQHRNEISRDTAERMLYLDAGADFACPGNEILHELVNRYGPGNKEEFPEIFRLYRFEKKPR